MEIIDALEESWALGAKLVGKLDDAHLTLPTPCAGWHVQALLNHTLGEASWRESGLRGERTYFYGTFPAGASALINLGEVVVHTWDLADATGIDAPMDPDHAALIYSLYSAFPLDGMRSSGQLGPEVPVPGDAPVTNRLLGLLGRDV